MFFQGLLTLGLTVSTLAAENWETLPATPALPAPVSNVRQLINGAELWYQKYNEAAGGTPVILIHGGLGYSAYFSDVISQLSQSRYVIAVDRRGHGRSSYLASDAFTFEQFAKDTNDLLKSIGVTKSVWVGWSDGAATTLAGLLDGGINGAISKAFVFAGFQSYKDTNATFAETSIYQEFVSRCASEYATLEPNANFTDFAGKAATLESTLPTWSDATLAGIDGSKVLIAGAEYDEAVNLDVAPHLSSVISGSKLKILSGVSHFAPVQDPAQFAQAVAEFL